VRNRKRLLPLLPIVLLSLTSCAGGVSEASDVTACPQVVEYTPEFLNRLADEIEALPAGSALERVVLDYRRLRAEVQAC
jgi:hypothetical protein